MSALAASSPAKPGPLPAPSVEDLHRDGTRALEDHLARLMGRTPPIPIRQRVDPSRQRHPRPRPPVWTLAQLLPHVDACASRPQLCTTLRSALLVVGGGTASPAVLEVLLGHALAHAVVLATAASEPHDAETACAAALCEVVGEVAATLVRQQLPLPDAAAINRAAFERAIARCLSGDGGARGTVLAPAPPRSSLPHATSRPSGASSNNPLLPGAFAALRVMRLGVLASCGEPTGPGSALLPPTPRTLLGLLRGCAVRGDVQNAFGVLLPLMDALGYTRGAAAYASLIECLARAQGPAARLGVPMGRPILGQVAPRVGLGVLAARLLREMQGGPAAIPGAPSGRALEAMRDGNERLLRWDVDMSVVVGGEGSATDPYFASNRHRTRPPHGHKGPAPPPLSPHPVPHASSLPPFPSSSLPLRGYPSFPSPDRHMFRHVLAACVKAADADTALAVLAHMAGGNDPVVAVGGGGTSGGSADADEATRAARTNGFKFDGHDDIFKLDGHDRRYGGLGHVAPRAPPPGLDHYGCVVAACAAAGRLSDAERVVGSMMARGAVPAAWVVRPLLQAYADAGDTGAAARLVADLTARGVAMSAPALKAVLRACARQGDVDACWRLLDQVKAGGGNRLGGAGGGGGPYGDGGGPSNGPSGGGPGPDGSSVGQALAGAATPQSRPPSPLMEELLASVLHVCVAAQDAASSARLLTGMRTRQLSPTPKLSTLALRACASPDDAAQVCAAMVGPPVLSPQTEREVAPLLVDDSHGVGAVSARARVVPSVAAWNAHLASIATARVATASDAGIAAGGAEADEGDGVVAAGGDGDSYSDHIQYSDHSRGGEHGRGMHNGGDRRGTQASVEWVRAEQAAELVSCMRSAGVAPNAATYTLLMALHARAGDVAGAERTLAMMRQACGDRWQQQPSPSSWAVVPSDATANDHIGPALATSRGTPPWPPSDGARPPRWDARGEIEAHAAGHEGRMKSASHGSGAIHGCGIDMGGGAIPVSGGSDLVGGGVSVLGGGMASPAVAAYSSLALAYATAGDARGAERVLARMRGEGVAPNAVTLRAVLSARLAAGELEQAVTLVEQVLGDPAAMAVLRGVAAPRTEGRAEDAASSGMEPSVGQGGARVASSGHEDRPLGAAVDARGTAATDPLPPHRSTQGMGGPLASPQGDGVRSRHANAGGPLQRAFESLDGTRGGAAGGGDQHLAWQEAVAGAEGLFLTLVTGLEKRAANTWHVAPLLARAAGVLVRLQEQGGVAPTGNMLRGMASLFGMCGEVGAAKRLAAAILTGGEVPPFVYQHGGDGAWAAMDDWAADRQGKRGRAGGAGVGHSLHASGPQMPSDPSSAFMRNARWPVTAEEEEDILPAGSALPSLPSPSPSPLPSATPRSTLRARAALASNALVCAYANAGQLAQARAVLRRMARAGQAVDGRSRVALLRACARVGAGDAAVELVSQLVHQAGEHQAGDTGQQGRPHSPRHHWHTGQWAWDPPDARWRNPGRVSQGPEGAAGSLDDTGHGSNERGALASSAGGAPGGHVASCTDSAPPFPALTPSELSSLTAALSRSGAVEQARALVARSSARGVRPTVAAYSSLALGYALGGRVVEAFAVLREMDAAGVRANLWTYGMLSHACMQVAEGEWALHVLDEMRARGLAPNVVHFTHAIAALVKQGQPSRALSLQRDMADAGVRPNASTYMWLVRATWQLAPAPHGARGNGIHAGGGFSADASVATVHQPDDNGGNGVGAHGGGQRGCLRTALALFREMRSASVRGSSGLYAAMYRAALMHDTAGGDGEGDGADGGVCAGSTRGDAQGEATWEGTAPMGGALTPQVPGAQSTLRSQAAMEILVGAREDGVILGLDIHHRLRMMVRRIG